MLPHASHWRDSSEEETREGPTRAHKDRYFPRRLKKMNPAPRSTPVTQKARSAAGLRSVSGA